MDKNTKFPYVLPTDRVQKEKVPTFYFGALTMSNWLKLNKRAKAIDKCKTVEDALAELCSMINSQLVGWENMTNPATGKDLAFSKKKLCDLITMDEGWNLIEGIKNQGVEVQDRKNLSSPSKSSKA